MKMNKVLLTVLSFFLALAANAQKQEECKKKFESYEALVLNRDYDAAAPLLKDLIKECPKYSVDTYLYGEEIYKIKAESSRTPEDKQANIDTLLTLYADYEKNFPGNGSVVRKAMLMKEHKLADDEEVFKALDGFYTTNRKKFTDYDALQEYFMLYLKRYEAGDKNITGTDFIEKYTGIAAQVTYARNMFIAEKAALQDKQEKEPLTRREKQFLKNADNFINALSAVHQNIDKLSSNYVSCESLADYYGSRFEEHKDDAAWLESVASVLYENKCYREDVLYNTAVASYKNNRTAATAFRAGDVTLKKTKKDEAIGYFEDAIALETSPSRKAELYMHIAGIYRNIDKGEAKKYALMAASANAKSGEPYLFLAELYSSVGSRDCGLNDFQQKALLFKAIDMVNKAAAAEPKYKPTAQALVKQYTDRLPNKDEAKAAGYKKGDEVQYGCWINETVKLPKL
ncbi:hypothetical protein KJK34_08540 [Flavobacterium sp. D11R37]|uniref:hypothetical protein n=1 Tax=Flavobacterium coralii TaxID=2838017 RepID=UPI001CA78E36|nr:hypothetical protein [Flavobacterium coralii]MBY8962794.1 hypothetical protein [Flavobacterium coralii]